MIDLPNGLVWGYHGTTSRYADEHLRNGIPTTTYPGDWEGNGAYFWEGDPDRAKEWSLMHVIPRHGGHSVVLAAVIDIGTKCLDLTRMADRDLVVATQRALYDEMSQAERERVKQTYYRRELDCLTINYIVAKLGYAVVRGAFREGSPLYATIEGHESGIFDRDHIQINVIDKSAIKLLRVVRS